MTLCRADTRAAVLAAVRQTGAAWCSTGGVQSHFRFSLPVAGFISSKDSTINPDETCWLHDQCMQVLLQDVQPAQQLQTEPPIRTHAEMSTSETHINVEAVRERSVCASLLELLSLPG